MFLLPLIYKYSKAVLNDRSHQLKIFTDKNVEFDYCILVAIVLMVEVFPNKSGDVRPDVGVELEELEEEIEVECSVLHGTDD